jgi:hypothetical protein
MRQEEQSRTCRFEELAHDWSVMSSEVVEHDNVAWVESRAQSLGRKFDEARPVNRANEVFGRACDPLAQRR